MSSHSHPTQSHLTQSHPAHSHPTQSRTASSRTTPSLSLPSSSTPKTLTPGRPTPNRRASAAAAEPLPAAHLRLTRRGRLVLASLAALPLVAVAGAFALNGGTAAASGESSWQTFDYVQVVSGQSLWQLAESIAPGADPRDVVSDLVHLNQLSSADVQPGQRLAVPADYSD